jgi:hypothetical protein
MAYSGISANPFLVPQSIWQSPIQGVSAFNPYAVQQPLQQTQQLLQVVAQQLQQLQQLEYVQQHQLQQLQQVVQSIPAQLVQLHLAQQTQQQPFNPAGIPLSPLWSASQVGSQPNYVM